MISSTRPARTFSIKLFFYRTLQGIRHRNLCIMPTCIMSLFTRIFIRMFIDLAGLLAFGIVILTGFFLFESKRQES